MNQKNPPSWHLICGAFHPQISSVGNYTFNLAKGLQNAHSNIHIWTKKYQHEKTIENHSNISIHRCVKHWDSLELSKIDHLLEKMPEKKIIFLQYTPHEFSKTWNKKLHIWLKNRK